MIQEAMVFLVSNNCMLKLLNCFEKSYAIKVASNQVSFLES